MAFQTPTWFPRAEDVQRSLPWNRPTEAQREATERTRRRAQLRQDLSDMVAAGEIVANTNRSNLRQDIPLMNEVADSASARENSSANQEADRQIRLNTSTAGLTQDTLRTGGQVAGGVMTTATDNQIRAGQAGAETFVNTVLPGMRELIGDQQGQEQWAMGKLIGEGSLLPQLTDLRRYEIDQQVALARDQMPPKWAQALGPILQTGALVGALIS